ncbi:MAG: 1-deoxy-D-xylulose-5-phosphate synthase [Spirochaetales bacterium]|nr:1-deoxy-D-xylulose-5-phosphate synthase [Leptospiraceae bacterium]MCP5480770.1 1-deoxy-D-xylulose-5-phosphate synthase [Spirochaetales bacterium]
MGKYPLLDEIESPADIRRLPESDLPRLCGEVRDYLIDTLSMVGGHFASNLGVVELTVALHYVLETPADKLIWDVGHQIYPHKILTGRRERLKSVRRRGGLSGFPRRDESPYDLYNTGHAGTSISQLLGEAMARDRLGLKHRCACVIGDASIASGMAFEALNHGGHVKSDCLVVLNDNDMSISHNVGALNQYLNRLITSPLYNRWKRFWYTLIMWVPVVGPALQAFSRRIEKSFKDFLTPGGLFADLGFRYVGPVDGHNVLELVRVLRKIVRLRGPIVLHAYSQKGKGYQPAENNPIRYHSVTMFNRADGTFAGGKASSDQVGFSQIVGDTLLEVARKNDRVVAITPAMIEGSGLRPLADAMPERVYDVGIAEQHSMSFAGGLASGGAIPYLCIYSTFLNRALDQLIQDVGLMNFPVRMVVDRAGCVGPDGETHQGLYDMGVLLAVPNVRLYAPATGGELKAMLLFMEGFDEGPIAVRFPKAACDRSTLDQLPDVSKIAPEVSGSGRDLAIVCPGITWEAGLELERELRNKHGILSTVVGLRWIRPLDVESLIELLGACAHFIVVEDSYIYSSAAAYIVANLPLDIRGRHIKTYAFPEEAIPHGSREEIMADYGLTPSAIAADLLTHPAFSGKVFPSLAKPSEV